MRCCLLRFQGRRIRKCAWLAGPFLLWQPVGLRAQNSQSTVVAAADTVEAVPLPVAKPVRKPDQVITNDTIGLLAVRRVPLIVPPTAPATVPATNASASGDAVAKRTAEIASLERQIPERQKRIALLMKLFVQDEQAFLRNPSGTADPAVEERRRYEQDELRWETAELAKMKASLEKMKNTNSSTQK